MIRNANHLAFVRDLPCVSCDATPSQAAHVRFGGSMDAKGGMGMKPSDARVVPLCARCHGRQHAMPERDFWAGLGVDPERLAAALWDASGNHAVAEEIIRQARW